MWHRIKSCVFLSSSFLQLASELWPGSAAVEADADSDDGELEEDLEKQVAKELASIKRPRQERKFGMSHPHCPRGPEIRVEWPIT